MAYWSWRGDGLYRARSRERRDKSRAVEALCSLLFLLYFLYTSEGAFRDDFLGAKSVAMGGAYTALADDVDGALVNPAGLSMIRGQQIMATTAALYVGLSDDSLISQNILGYAYQQSENWALGMAWKWLGAGGLYSENVLALSFARAFSFSGRRSRILRVRGSRDSSHSATREM
jgi:hypothetical protein